MRPEAKHGVGTRRENEREKKSARRPHGSRQKEKVKKKKGHFWKTGKFKVKLGC
jgi:hypothetical protein